MSIRKIFFIALLSLLYVTPIHAQSQDERQLMAAAEEAFQIGRVSDAQEMLKGRVQNLSNTLRLRGYRLLSLCALAFDQMDEARMYAVKMLQENPYYSPTVDYPPRFIDLVNDIKQGMEINVTTGSNQSESVNEAPSPITIITAEMIEELGYQRNLNQILATYVPGMAQIASDSPYGNMSMHGAYAAEQELIMVMENGHRLNNRTENVGIMSYNISTEIIDHIEVLRGPASSMYGNVAVSAVVNIITKNGRSIDGVKLRYGHGSYNTNKADIVMGTRFMDADIAVWASVFNSVGQVRHFNDDKGYYSSINKVHEKDITRDFGADSIYIDSYRNIPSYDIGMTLKLKGFDLMVSRKNVKKVYQVGIGSGYDYSLFPNINGIKPGKANDATHAEIGYTRQIGPIALNASVYGDWYHITEYKPVSDLHCIIIDEDTTYTTGRIEYSSYKESTYGGYLKAYADYRLWRMKGNILVGSQYENFSLHSWLRFDGVNFGSIESGSFNYEELFSLGKEQNLSFFLQDKHYILPQLIVNLGLRYDIKYRKDVNFTSLSPRLALMYVPSNLFSLKLSYAQSYADINFFYRYIYYYDNTMKPQHLTAFRLTAMGKVLPLHLSYEVNTFYNRYSKLMRWYERLDEDLPFGDSGNHGKLENIGIEGVAQFAYNRFTSNLTLYYCHDLNSENYYYNHSENIVTNVPHFTMNLHGAYKLIQAKSHELKIYGNAKYQSKMLNYTHYESDDYYVDGNILFDLGMKYSFRQRLQLTLDCENIFDTIEYLCGPTTNSTPIFRHGRMLMGSISYQF